MGFGPFGKKTKSDEAADTQAKPKGSRRIVAPGSSGNTQAIANPAASKDVRKGPIQVSSKGVSSRLAAEGNQPPQPSAAAPAPQPKQAPVPTGDVPTTASQPRPKSREPIIAGQSEPPKFSGNLSVGSGRKSTPCRTGDVALLDFLENKQVALVNREQKIALITHEQVVLVRSKAEAEALPIDVAAVQLGFITEEQMVNALTSACWVPHLRVDKYEIRKKALDTIAREDAIYYGVFPVDKLGSLLTLAMVNPLDEETIRVLGNKTNLDIKKVVATRSEITQGIEKYYSGQIQVTDGSRSFSQDVEPKSVTQMMAKVVAPAPPVSSGRSNRSNQQLHAPAENIVPEIQDIDDLLSSDEAIAPAIIEPISLKAEAEIVTADDSLPMPQFEAITDEPALVGGSPMAFTPSLGSPAQQPLSAPAFELDMGSPPVIPAPAILPAKPAPLPERAPAASSAPTLDLGYDEATSAIHGNESVLTRKASATPKTEPGPTAKLKPKTEGFLAPEFEQDGAALPAKAASATPAPLKTSQPPIKPPTPAVPSPHVVAPTQPALRSNPPAPASEKRQSDRVAKPAPPAGAASGTGQVARPVSSRFTGTGRTKKVGVVNLIPVMEEEFQHAITHGKSHVFEKWIGLQSRNRIINAQAIDADFESRLPLLFVNSRRL